MKAVFVDDLPRYGGELYLEFVTATVASGRLVKVDPAPALSLQGVTHFISARYIDPRMLYCSVLNDRDVPGREYKVPFATAGARDEVVFAEEEVQYEGQPVGAVLATSEELARRAARLVIVGKIDNTDTMKPSRVS